MLVEQRIEDDAGGSLDVSQYAIKLLVGALLDVGASLIHDLTSVGRKLAVAAHLHVRRLHDLRRRFLNWTPRSRYSRCAR